MDRFDPLRMQILILMYGTVQNVHRIEFRFPILTNVVAFFNPSCHQIDLKSVIIDYFVDILIYFQFKYIRFYHFGHLVRSYSFENDLLCFALLKASNSLAWMIRNFHIEIHVRDFSNYVRKSKLTNTHLAWILLRYLGHWTCKSSKSF